MSNSPSSTDPFKPNEASPTASASESTASSLPLVATSTPVISATSTPLATTTSAPPFIEKTAVPIATARTPTRQLADLDRDELDRLATELGLDAAKYPSRQHLVAAIHERRQLIANMDREAMLEVCRWAKRPAPANAGREQLALQITGVCSMRFSGLSQRGLLILARLRGLDVLDGELTPSLVTKLKKQEGFFSRLNRKRRSMIGQLVSNMLGEDDRASSATFESPQNTTESESAKTPTQQRLESKTPVQRESSIKEEIEDAGLIGGLANRVKKTADSYINQKLDEIESRIDRKLDEIDRRLAEWRDKEIANRIRILKITLWVSVIVGVFSLIYSYVQVYLPHR